MPRRTEYSYTQICLGVCGHLCEEWPLVSGIGGTDPQVVCGTCTQEEYGLEDWEASGLYVWVRIRERSPDKPKPAKKARKPKPKKPNIWDQFLPDSK